MAAAPCGEPVPQDWRCTNCETANFRKRTSCTTCGQSKPELRDQITHSKIFKQGDWQCYHCTNVNWDWREICNRCQRLRPDVEIRNRQRHEETRTLRRSEEGKAGGFFERQAIEKKEWNSDDEDCDEFGRKKKAAAAGTSAADAAADRARMSRTEKQRAALEKLRQRAGGTGKKDRSRSR
eukprot:gnl/TRDRNA2_/TRDRNA2_110221_c0_seq1.p2 gnl/TRDRNA2_/TRDRNA2_110221_c0~~gnl/TRDRNA2_/TRDRNA2_110221_c0_seq1.p2  ORF type:complete len:180 (+),score=37.67 gnl/TRDRNA2_/TRDRNA2_110221_c0_seq1:88-627(+)